MEKQDIKIIREQLFLENFANLLRFAKSHQEERWFSENPDPLNGPCPICEELAALGWVEFGLLPRYKKAHSIIGEGRWKSSDEDCLCVKGYRRVKGNPSENVIPISGYNGANSIADPKLKFSEEKKYTTEEVKEKLKQLKIKFSSHNGCSHKQ